MNQIAAKSRELAAQVDSIGSILNRRSGTVEFSDLISQLCDSVGGESELVNIVKEQFNLARGLTKDGQERTTDDDRRLNPHRPALAQKYLDMILRLIVKENELRAQQTGEMTPDEAAEVLREVAIKAFTEDPILRRQTIAALLQDMPNFREELEDQLGIVSAALEI